MSATQAQQTNPVDRQVTNPITDTPNVNPLQGEQPIVRPRVVTDVPVPPGTISISGEADERLEVVADRQTAAGPENARVIVYEGNVDTRIGVYRLQADRITVYEETERVVAEGNVVFDQTPGQRITGSRAEWNYRTKLGFFVNSTGFTNQTQDGTVIYFTADRVEKVATNRIIALNAVITACDEDVPKWSFRTSRAEITLNDRVRVRRPSFRVRNIPVLALPYASVSIRRRDRSSGFLTPTFSGSGNKGFRLSNAYYLTLGRSADVTLRNDIYTGRGLGFGADVRTRANSRSYFDFGFFTVKDRIFGASASAENPDQGGSSFYARGVQYFSNGFLAAADVNITSNLAFRQVFSDAIQLAISPEERSQVFINRNFGDYSFNFLARTQVTSIPNVRIRTRQLPSVTLERRPATLRYFERLPIYFSFYGAIEGVSRKETIEDLAAFVREGNQNPLITPSIVQRFDFNPRFSIPFNYRGWSATVMGALRTTFYSNSIEPSTRLVSNNNVVRGYGEFEIDVRPPVLARDFTRGDGRFRFRHTIEPYLVYRKIGGINDFERVIRVDYTDAIADTNEIEFGVANRFFTRRSTETVGGANGDGTNGATNNVPLSSQPYEALSVTVRGKYFFDPDFGGALVPGRRNQFYPINTFSGFTYGGVPRRFSPVNVTVRYRPGAELFVDSRLNLDLLGEGGGLRDLAISFGLNRPLVQAFQTFYYTRAVKLAPSLQQFSNPQGNEPGTLQGSQWSPTLFLGNRERGLFGGLSLFFDFQNRADRGGTSLVSSTTTIGYTFDCCSVVVQNYSFDVGLRKENRFVFSFRLNGIGTFGTEQIGQQFR